MRLKNRGVRRPLTEEELISEFALEKMYGESAVDNLIQKISLDKVSLEDRRREAKKPLYLVRYE